MTLDISDINVHLISDKSLLIMNRLL